jgi:hypothetical protein
MTQHKAAIALVVVLSVLLALAIAGMQILATPTPAR